MQPMIEQARAVRLMIFDVDGVMTDGGLLYSDSGEELKSFNSLDGHGLKMLQSTGVKLAIITGRTSRLVEHRARNLGIQYLYQGAHDKLSAFEALLAETSVSATECGYMGDDVVDLPVMRRVAFSAGVPHAPELVLRHAHFVPQRAAGHGAVREVCEAIMQAQGTLEGVLAHYLR
ncbi:HAD family hydrolase [Chitiniphilus purpureus]|uniref:HAD family hydrolase n=1 Tax=Chitiniphilus purpureus TaxID=2981137 RepID=A0ABY6DMN9_9NEIS|nr:HAD family hydrolase [Chitiniphilus sp. CD1]UXY15272.1 HAD family hydrolase [Chitiniphilus sp. CD1]